MTELLPWCSRICTSGSVKELDVWHARLSHNSQHMRLLGEKYPSPPRVPHNWVLNAPRSVALGIAVTVWYGNKANISSTGGKEVGKGGRMGKCVCALYFYTILNWIFPPPFSVRVCVCSCWIKGGWNMRQIGRCLLLTEVASWKVWNMFHICYLFCSPVELLFTFYNFNGFFEKMIFTSLTSTFLPNKACAFFNNCTTGKHWQKTQMYTSIKYMQITFYSL